MSYNSLARQITDLALNNRIMAAVEKEAWNNPALHDTDYGTAIRQGMAGTQTMGWPVCIATEAAYEYAINSGNADPGGDPTVITDADLLAAVQANWPDDPWPPPAPVPGGV